MKHGRRRTFLVRLLCVAPLAALVVGGTALSADAATTRVGVSVGGSALDTIGSAVGAITVPHPGGSTGTTPSTGVGSGVGSGAGSGVGSGAGSGGNDSAVDIGVGAGGDSRPGSKTDGDQPATSPGSTPSSSSGSTPSSSSGSSSDEGSAAASGGGKATGAKAGTHNGAGTRTKAKWVPGTVSEVGLTAGDSSDGDENRVSGGIQSGEISAQLMAAATSFGWTNLGILTLITLLWGAWQVVKFRQRSARERTAPNANASFLESLPEPDREPSFRELISS